MDAPTAFMSLQSWHYSEHFELIQNGQLVADETFSIIIWYNSFVFWIQF